jgi:hypothetical protein
MRHEYAVALRGPLKKRPPQGDGYRNIVILRCEPPFGEPRRMAASVLVKAN